MMGATGRIQGRLRCAHPGLLPPDLRDTTGERPAWTRKLGNEPSHAEERAAWAERIGTIAAYREQQQIVDSDPHHPAGPHIETDHADYEAYSHALRAASELRQAARDQDLAGVGSAMARRASRVVSVRR